GVAKQQYALKTPENSVAQNIELNADSAVIAEQRAETSAAQPVPAAPAAGNLTLLENVPLKSAPQLSVARAKAVVTPIWTITSAGGLQKSYDQGKNWQDVDVNGDSTSAALEAEYAPPDKLARSKDERDTLKKVPSPSPAAVVFRTVVATGTEVWAG